MYWACCFKDAMVLFRPIFLNFGAGNFRFKIILRGASQSSFFRFGAEIGFWS
jgi:hypothetical protein